MNIYSECASVSCHKNPVSNYMRGMYRNNGLTSWIVGLLQCYLAFRRLLFSLSTETGGCMCAPDDPIALRICSHVDGTWWRVVRAWTFYTSHHTSKRVRYIGIYYVDARGARM